MADTELWADDDFRAVDKAIGTDVEKTYPGQVIHRIDTPVSGVLLLGKTARALEAGRALFADRTVRKVYWAIVGRPLAYDKGELRHWLSHAQEGNKTKAFREPGTGRQEAWLTYRHLATGDRYVLYEVELGTGRTHQIRAQFAAAGSPVKGDLKYGFARSNPGGGISLLARSLEFVHPFTKKRIVITAEPPEDRLWAALTGGRLPPTSPL